MSFGAILEFVFNNSISDGIVGLSLLFVVPVVLTHGLVILAFAPHTHALSLWAQMILNLEPKVVLISPQEGFAFASVEILGMPPT